MKKILLFMILTLLSTELVIADWIINRDKDVPYIRQNDYKDFGLSSCAPTSTAMILKYNFPNSYISSGQIYHAGTQAHYYAGPMKYYKNIGFQSCSTSVTATGICISDTEKTIIKTDGKQYFHGNYSGTVFSNIKSYLENSWRATVSTVIRDYSHIEEALRSTPLIANVNVCGSGGGHYLVLHNIDDNGTPNNTNDDYFIVNDPEPNCGIYQQTRHGKNKKIAVNTFFETWMKGNIYKITFPNTNNRILVEPSHSNIDGYTNGDSLEKYETYDYVKYTDKFDTTKTTFEPVGHVMEIEDENTDDVFYYARNGKSIIYLNKASSNKNITQVSWKPKLLEEGTYKIEYTTLDNGAKGDLSFELVGSNDVKKKDIKVRYSNENKFIKKTLFSSVNLEDGDYIRVKNIPQDINLGSVLFLKTDDISTGTYLSEKELKQGLNCTNNHNEGLKLAEGVLYCEVENENENGKIDKYNIVVADRNRPYRLRPIVEFTSKNIKYDSELKKYIKNGRFQTRSVLEHIENRGSENSNIIAAINGDAFSVDNKIPYHLGASVFATPSRTLIYGGLNIIQSPTIQAMFTFSSSYEKIGIGQLFQNLNGVNNKHNFSKQYHCEFGENCKNASLKSFIGQGSLSNIAKSHEVEGKLTWTIGLTQGSILGNVYEDGVWKTNQCWKENDSPEDGADYVSILSYSKDRIIMAVSTTKIHKNKHVCELFKTLNMDYAAYLDGGGSTQMIYRFPIEKNYLDSSPNNNERKVLSAIALVENYSDIATLAEEYKRAIYYLTDFGIMHGNNGKFGKGFSITRAEFAKMIIKLLTIMQQDMADTEDTSLSRYTDVDNVDWFRPYAKKVVGLGLMEGNKEKTKLSPNENITYWELSKIISIAFQGKNIKEPIESKLVEPKNGWHNRYLQCLDNYGEGYSNRFKEKYINIFKDKLQAYYDPNQKIWFSKYATREDVALFLYRAFILWQDGKFDDVSKSCVKK